MQLRILAFFFLTLSFAACQTGTEDALSLTAGIGFEPTAADRQAPENPLPSATNIIFQSADGGQTWEDVSAGLPAEPLIRTVISNGAEVFLNAEKGLFRSPVAEQEMLWELENSTYKPDNIFHVFPTQEGLLAYNHTDGFSQKVVGLQMWIPAFSTLKGEWVHTLFQAADGTFFIGSNSGILKSADGGLTWKKVFTKNVVTAFVEMDGVLFAADYQGVLRSTDGGEQWEYALNERNRSFSIRRTKGGVTVILHDNLESRKQDQLLTSTDGGKTWQNLHDKLPTSRMIVDFQQVGNEFFCSLEEGVFRSADQGKTWELVHSLRGKLFRLAVSGGKIFAVVADAGC